MTPPEESSSNRRTWLGLAVIVALVAAVAWFANRSTDKVTGTVDFPEVLYEVEGTTDYADVTYQTPTGSEQASPDVPMKTSTGPRAGERGLLVTGFLPGDFVYISAQNNRETGTVTCRISIDGVTISENSSSSAYGVASCKGTAR